MFSSFFHSRSHPVSAFFSVAIPGLREGRTRLAAAAIAGVVSLSGCAVSFPVPTPPATEAKLINNGNDGVMIPLHVERADQDHARLGLPVQLDGKSVYVALDTGTQGVRVLSSVLPRQGDASAGSNSTLVFANNAQVSGPSVSVPVSLIGTKSVDLTVQAVNDVHCLSIDKKCVAIDGYTGEFGWAFSGLYGVGLQQPDDSCCTQPLRALPGNLGQRYFVRSSFDNPFLLLSPSDTLTKSFTMAPMSVSKDGEPQWPVGCVQVADKMRYCAPVVFSTGSTGMVRIETDTVPNWVDDAGDHAVMKQGNFDVALGIGKWTHRYDSAQVTIVKKPAGINRIVIGLMAMQKIDVLIDFPHRQVGLRASVENERFAP
ncbi:hypothetical protein [Paraburkholderia sp.]|uniref:hypothetical protein n=1 Tax=Paraburkholderia sp. TaxID=1926495 RepID=UPI0023A4D821|nr:hypothetical protein [Paraburkholderia sp.]MDE1179714.1 hypothetical protein [Paraburkholderia sp.]